MGSSNVSTFLTYVKDYLNKLTFNLRNIPGSEIFSDFVTTCLVADQPITNLRRSEINQFFRCVKKNVDTGNKLFEIAVSTCLSAWYRTKDFNRFTSCILEKVGNHPVANIVKVCAESLPDGEKLPYALTMCVYGGLDMFNMAMNRLRRDIKRLLR